MFKLNLILVLIAVVSAISLIDGRREIREQVNIWGRNEKEAVILKQQYADLRYEYSKSSEPMRVQKIAEHLNMQPIPNFKPQ